MKTIYKYALTFQSGKNPEEPMAVATVKVPRGAKLLDIQPQKGGDPVAWFQVDTNLDPVDRTFALWGTGWEMSHVHLDRWKYVKTIQIDWFVWHIFEEEK